MGPVPEHTVPELGLAEGSLPSPPGMSCCLCQEVMLIFMGNTSFLTDGGGVPCLFRWIPCALSFRAVVSRPGS